MDAVRGSMSSRSLKILLVENHPDTRVYLAGYLSSCGHDVQTALDVPGALALLPSRMDVLLCDIHLGEGNGWQLMEQVRQNRAVFAIAMSGIGTPDDQEKSLRAGFHHHLVKPFLPEELDHLLEKAAVFLRDLEKSTRGEGLSNDSLTTTKGTSC